jgi:hypothetical protein
MISFQKYLQKLQVTGLMDERGSVSRCSIFNRPKLYGRHIESCSTGVTKEGIVLMSCFIVM